MAGAETGIELVGGYDSLQGVQNSSGRYRNYWFVGVTDLGLYYDKRGGIFSAGG